MTSTMSATNGFMAFLWILAWVLILVIVAPEFDDPDPRAQTAGDAVVGHLSFLTLFMAALYIGAAVGTGLDATWAEGLSMMLLPFTFIVLPIFIWQMVALLRQRVEPPR